MVEKPAAVGVGEKAPEIRCKFVKVGILHSSTQSVGGRLGKSGPKIKSVGSRDLKISG